MYADCDKKQQALGYIGLDEFEKREGRKVIPSDNIGVTPSLQPVWEINMKWEYAVNGNKDQLSYMKVIKKNDSENKYTYELVDQSNLTYIYDEKLYLCSTIKDGSVASEFIPPNRTYEWPLTVGKKWIAKGKIKTGQAETNVSTHYEVKDYGKVSVPAGTFDVYYIIAKSDNGARYLEIWYAPSIRYLAKYVSYTEAGWTKYELLRYTTEKEPAIVESNDIPTTKHVETPVISETKDVTPTKSVETPVVSESRVKDWNTATKKLEALGELFNKGLITKEEYDLKRKELLDSY